MGYAYTPGLTVAERTVVRKVRRLPIAGRVLVQVGQTVEADDVVAETSLPGEAVALKAADRLGIPPEDLPSAMLKREGDGVTKGEVLARTRGLFGLFKSEVTCPLDGTIESVSKITGQVILRGVPVPLQKRAYARGRVVAVQAGESATVEVVGTFVQGIFGVGGETTGVLEVLASNPDEVLDAPRIGAAHAGRIIVGGGLVTAAAVRAARQHGVRGIVCGGLDDADLRAFLGYELGVAITGEETLGLTLVITEGFGPIGMAARTFELLRRRSGQLASMNGATQIRAGVIRPEVLIPDAESGGRPGAPDEVGAAAERSAVLEVGTPLRAIRDPYFGRIGRCTALPVGLVRLPTESEARVLEVEFEDGQRVVLPRANVELIHR